MRVVDLIKNTKKTAFSFEVLPPLKGTGIEKLYHDIDILREFDPQYINITTHRSEYVYKELGNGLFERTRLRRRPGTVAVAAAIHNKYNITTVPHILCSGFSREDIEYVLLDLQFPWRPTRGSLTSPSYLVRNRTLGPPLENNPEIPPSSRDEGLRLLHGQETNLAASLQTPQEA